MQGQTLRQVILTEYVERDSERRGLSKYTIRTKRQSFDRFIRWLGDRPFTLAVCQEFLDYLRQDCGNQPSSVALEGRKLRAVIRWLKRNRYIKTDFSKELVLPRLHQKDIQLVTAEQAKEVILSGTEPGEYDHRLHRIAKANMRAALMFMVKTGIRMRELKDLRPDDFNFEVSSYRVHGKSGETTNMPLPVDMIPELKERVAHTFKNRPVFPVCEKTMNLALRRGAEKLGVKVYIHCHLLRHIFVTSLGNSGVPVQFTSRLVRHSSVGITDKYYTHYCLQDLQKWLNAFHPLISGGLTKEQAFELVESAVRTTAVSKDSRFQLVVDKAEDELVVRLKVV